METVSNKTTSNGIRLIEKLLPVTNITDDKESYEVETILKTTLEIKLTDGNNIPVDSYGVIIDIQSIERESPSLMMGVVSFIVVVRFKTVCGFKDTSFFLQELSKNFIIISEEEFLKSI